MFNYAQLNNEHFCIGVSSVYAEITNDNMILIDTYDTSFLNRKYDYQKKVWTDDYYIQKPIIIESEHEVLTKTINNNLELTSFDNLLNMDILISLDEKLNKIIEHLGI